MREYTESASLSTFTQREYERADWEGERPLLIYRKGETDFRERLRERETYVQRQRLERLSQSLERWDRERQRPERERQTDRLHFPRHTIFHTDTPWFRRQRQRQIWVEMRSPEARDETWDRERQRETRVEISHVLADRERQPRDREKQRDRETYEEREDLHLERDRGVETPERPESHLPIERESWQRDKRETV